MTDDEQCSSDVERLNEHLKSGGSVEHDVQPPGVAPLGEKPGPRLVSLADREQAAVRLADSLTNAISQYLGYAEKRAVTQADKIRALALGDLERQRASVEKLVGLFAERLGRQDEALTTLQETIALITHRLDRQAEAIRSLGKAQAEYWALVSQVRNVLKSLGNSLEDLPSAAGEDAAESTESRIGYSEADAPSREGRK